MLKRKKKAEIANKKIKNATKCEYNGIKFKSKLEQFCYIKLLDLVPDPGYEKWKEVLMCGFYPKTQVFIPNKQKEIELCEYKIHSITYTPDFYFKYNNYIIFVDTKGMSNDTYPIKKKLFLKNWELIPNAKVCFFEPHSQKQVLQCIKIIKQL